MRARHTSTALLIRSTRPSQAKAKADAVQPVCSWSRNSRYLVTGSRDWNAIVWDVATGDRRETIRFDTPVTSAVFHPRNSKILVVTLQNSAEAVIVDLRAGQAGSSRFELVSQRVDDAPIAEEHAAEPAEDAEAEADIAEAASQTRKSGKSRGKSKQAKASTADGGSKKRRWANVAQVRARDVRD